MNHTYLKTGHLYYSRIYNSLVLLLNKKEKYTYTFLVLNSCMDHRLTVRNKCLYANGNCQFNISLSDITDDVDSVFKFKNLLYNKKEIKMLILLYEK